MTFLRQSQGNPLYRWAILISIGLLGVLMTLWVYQSLSGSGHQRFVLPLGILATLFLLLFLHVLLGRSELARKLAVGHEDALEQRRTAELWAGKLSQAVEQNPAAIVITDTDGCIEYVNEQYVQSTGYSRAELIGQNSRLIKSGNTPPEVYQDLWATITAGQNWQGDLQNRKRDGSLYWEHALISPIKDATGKVRNFIGIKEDVTEFRQLLARVQVSESRFRGVLSVISEGLAVISADWIWLYANPVAEAILGQPPGTLVGKTSLNLKVDCLHPDGNVLPPEEFSTHRVLRDGKPIQDCETGFRYPDGRIRWCRVNCSPLGFDAEGKATGAVITFYDITARRRTEAQLKLAQAAINGSGEAILLASAGQKIGAVNPAFERLTGYASDEVVGRGAGMLDSDDPGESISQLPLQALARIGYWQGKILVRCKNGKLCPVWLGVSVVREENRALEHYIYIFSDMTERMEVQRNIRFLAHHDPLTGLPNRLLLRDRMEQAVALAGRMQSCVALMILDLDRFKTINDSLGHPVGDALLKEVVERLKGCVRESDTISRQGGDEFIILLNDVRDSEAVARVADKINQCMAAPVVLDKHVLNTTFSIGIALYPNDGLDFDSLLQKADTAMYHAKESGRNGHRFFTEEMNQQVVEHMTLETQLRKALEKKEFILHYQPQLDLQEGKIVGVEALIRWNSPGNGMVSPARFIPVAENCGLIVPIGAWVLNEACRQAKAWQDAGLPPFVVAVNLSAVQFKRQELITSVINALVLSDLDSQWLELELTESILIQDAEATLDAVRRLKALGVKLSVDDFGTGYSSLAYLKRFAVDKLKIDQSFIRDLVADPDDAAIVRAIIQMAHSLKLKTIAEGVESEELSNLLRMFHCDEIQGYWFARPMPADQLEDFVRSHLAKSN